MARGRGAARRDPPPFPSLEPHPRRRRRRDCALHLQVKGGKAEPERIFGSLHTFALSLEKAHEFNVEFAEREAKKARMAVAAKLREVEMEQRRAGAGAPAGKPGAGGAPPGRGALSGLRPPGAPVGPPLGFGGAAKDELAAKLANRANRGNLVDGVAEGMASGSLLLQRRQESFARRASLKRSAAPAKGKTGAAPKPAPASKPKAGPKTNRL